MNDTRTLHATEDLAALDQLDAVEATLGSSPADQVWLAAIRELRASLSPWSSVTRSTGAKGGTRRVPGTAPTR